ncbi:MAG: hypothetical protein HKP20_02720, partial [Akkermansiaceae bacterium]|nr:hypothetical protein [Akkermansiaceae bacterium]
MLAQEPGDNSSAAVDPPAATARPDRPAVTHFGKISVVGSHQNLRGSIASMAENLRVELNKLCGDAKRQNKIPIIIQLHGKQGDRAQPRSLVSQIQRIQGQFQIILHIHLAKGIDHDLLRYHLMEVLLFERGLGEGQTLAEGERIIIKPWLIVGLLESIDIKQGRADKRIYQADIPFLEILGLQQVFDASEKQW